VIKNLCAEAAKRGQTIGDNCGHKPYDAILFSDGSHRCGATHDPFLWRSFSERRVILLQHPDPAGRSARWPPSDPEGFRQRSIYNANR